MALNVYAGMAIELYARYTCIYQLHIVIIILKNAIAQS